MFDKNPGANWLVAWHQDTALPLAVDTPAPGWGPWSNKDGIRYAHAPASALERVVALRIHLDESTPENGPLRVLPGTHVLGVLSDEQVHAQARRAAAQDCCAPAGSVVAMRPLVIHASSKSSTARPRRVLHIEYATTLEIAPACTGSGISRLSDARRRMTPTRLWALRGSRRRAPRANLRRCSTSTNGAMRQSSTIR